MMFSVDKGTYFYIIVKHWMIKKAFFSLKSKIIRLFFCRDTKNVYFWEIKI